MDKTVLIVEDDPEINFSVQKILQLSGYKVLSGANGRQGLEIAQSKIPDLIISDIMMPELDGFGMLEDVFDRVFNGQDVAAVIDVAVLDHGCQRRRLA